MEEKELTFEEGQVFEGTYPPDAAVWCNENGYHIEEMEKEGDVRKYQIVKNEVYIPTKEDILVQKESEYGMSRWQREGILAEGSGYSDYTKAKAQELEDLAAEVRK